MSKKKRLVSGIQASGKLHIGNYFGAMKQFEEYQNEYDSYVFVANFHALTTVKNADQLRADTKDVVLDYLAVGLDPEKVTLYTQTDIPEVTELSWYFNCLVTMPWLMRAHAFKDAGAKSKEINVGLFDYPVLMAADILLPNADVVPVGEDQRQHVEMAREVAEKFNNTYGETFKLPKELIRKEVAVVPGIDGRKMSKSYGNDIKLFGSDEEIRSQVMKIVTDSKGVEEPKDPEADNVFALHKLVSVGELSDLEKRYREGGIGYKESKELLAENIIKLVSPMREKRKEYETSPEKVQEILKEGGEKARAQASAKMKEVREKIGVI
ncbi:MAG TPA: tryptophan--tRNA ligase [Candidatus Paceibacterota bacterium]